MNLEVNNINLEVADGADGGGLGVGRGGGSSRTARLGGAEVADGGAARPCPSRLGRRRRDGDAGCEGGGCGLGRDLLYIRWQMWINNSNFKDK